jgi:hypothetical protein
MASYGSSFIGGHASSDGKKREQVQLPLFWRPILL